MKHTGTAWDAFNCDIPESKREDVLIMLCEAAHGTKHDAVTILSRDQLDAINVRVHGIVEVGGEEYTFILQDGNWNGTDLESWNDGKEFKRHTPTVWALQPRPDLVGDALMAGTGRNLVKRWDAVASREPYVSLAGNYAYDRHFQPGGQIESHYREKAAKGGFVITTKDEADAVRARLLEDPTNG